MHAESWLTASMACLAIHPKEQGVSLWGPWVACQGVLQRRNELVAVQRDHPVIVVPCTSKYCLLVVESNHQHAFWAADKHELTPVLKLESALQ